MKNKATVVHRGQHTNYEVMAVEGTSKLMKWDGECWIVDRTCGAINDLLQAGLITISNINTWIKQQAQPQGRG